MYRELKARQLAEGSEHFVEVNDVYPSLDGQPPLVAISTMAVYPSGRRNYVGALFEPADARLLAAALLDAAEAAESQSPVTVSTNTKEYAQ